MPVLSRMSYAIITCQLHMKEVPNSVPFSWTVRVSLSTFILSNSLAQRLAFIYPTVGPSYCVPWILLSDKQMYETGIHCVGEILPLEASIYSEGQEILCIEWNETALLRSQYLDSGSYWSQFNPVFTITSSRLYYKVSWCLYCGVLGCDNVPSVCYVVQYASHLQQRTRQKLQAAPKRQYQSAWLQGPHIPQFRV
jgi:hypothetical protein